jgi:hypothetical protein
MLLRSRTRLVTLVVGLSLLALLVLANIAPAAAAGGFMVERTYYSDASKTKEVGWSILSCTGGFVKKGTITSHFVEFKDPCW